MDFLGAVFGAGLVMFGVYIIGCSYCRQLYNLSNRKKPGKPYSSPAPFVGPIFVIVGLSALQVDLSVWILLLFAFDPDSVVVLLNLPVLLYKIVHRQ